MPRSRSAQMGKRNDGSRTNNQQAAMFCNTIPRQADISECGRRFSECADLPDFTRSRNRRAAPPISKDRGGPESSAPEAPCGLPVARCRRSRDKPLDNQATSNAGVARAEFQRYLTAVAPAAHYRLFQPNAVISFATSSAIRGYES